MRTSAELQKAMFAALAGDAALTSLLGGQKLFDHLPTKVSFPYVAFGRVSVDDWSTSTEEGAEHLVTLHAWSRAKGKAETLAIVQAMHDVLHDAALPLGAGATLVNMRVESTDVRFDEDAGAYRGAMRVRAMVEG